MGKTLLTRDQEADLARRIKEGDIEARNKLVLANQGLIRTIARTYRSALKMRGIPWDDAISEGVLGMIEAADRFDGSKGFRFASYAGYWVRLRIRDMIRPGVVHFTERGIRDWLRYYAAHQEMTRANGFEPSFDDVAERIGATGKKARENLARATVGQAHADWDRSAMFWVSREDSHDEVALMEIIDAVSKLGDRRRQVFELRMGMSGEPEMTMAEVAERIGMSKAIAHKDFGDAVEVIRRRIGA